MTGHEPHSYFERKKWGILVKLLMISSRQAQVEKWKFTARNVILNISRGRDALIESPPISRIKMLSDPANLTAQYGAPRGIIQIGAHYGQEYFPYKALGVKNFVMIEAIARHVDEMRSRITDPSVLIYETALGATVKNIEINLSDFSPPPWGLAEGDSLNEYKGMSSSILKPKKHLEENPWIEFKEKVTVPMTTLDALIKEKDINLSLYNMLNIDVQGYELEVLKGGRKLSWLYKIHIYRSKPRRSL